MIFISVFVTVYGAGGRGQILDQSSSQSHIDYLHALADAQYGYGFAQSHLQSLKLQNIQLGVYASGAVILFPEKSGGDVASAGQ
jgi:hypothetical protein